MSVLYSEVPEIQALREIGQDIISRHLVQHAPDVVIMGCLDAAVSIAKQYRVQGATTEVVAIEKMIQLLQRMKVATIESERELSSSRLSSEQETSGD